MEILVSPGTFQTYVGWLGTTYICFCFFLSLGMAYLYLLINFHILHRNIDSEWNMWSEAGGPAYGEMAGPNNFKYTDGSRIKDDLCKLWNM